MISESCFKCGNHFQDPYLDRNEFNKRIYCNRCVEKIYKKEVSRPLKEFGPSIEKQKILDEIKENKERGKKFSKIYERLLKKANLLYTKNFKNSKENILD